ncbi:MAG: hypothetical protein EBU92_12840, partial [Betaproteobacteria bacterium]|nr:hypothetical protein [Betaproteobacteria bacterium]
NIQLNAIDEDPTTNTGSTVSELFNSSFSDTADAVSGGSTANTLAGVAITANAATAAQGKWQYFLTGPQQWVDLPTVSASSSFYLDVSAKLRFSPATDYNGIPGGLTLRLVDSSSTLSSGSSVDTSSNGATSAFSAETLSLGTNIKPTNDAPTLSKVDTLTGVIEDTFSEITYNKLLDASDAKDIDAGDTLSFRIEQVTSGTLQKWNSSQSTWENVTAGTTTVSAGERLQWKANADANGIGLNAFTVKAIDAAGATSSTAIQVKADVTAVNDAPTFTAFTNNTYLQQGVKNNAVTLSLNDLLSKGNQQDVDGQVVGFKVTEVTSGSLQIKDTTTNSLTAWDAVKNCTVDNSHQLVWTPAANSIGVQAAFKVTAIDDKGLTSATPVQATVNILDNIPPSFTNFKSVFNGGKEDTEITISFNQLLSNSDATDTDGKVNAFVVKAVNSGSLKIGSTSASATAWTAGTNDTVDATHQLFWTPDANANGDLNAFSVVAQDNQSSNSTKAIDATFNVTSVNDAPTGTDSTITISEDGSKTFAAADFGFADANDSTP